LELDTARIYSGGDSELMLGRLLREEPGLKGRVRRINTKVHPAEPGGLSADGIRRQLDASLKALQVDKVDVLYLHQPDPENDLSESLRCVHELIAEGTVTGLALSNYSAVEVDRCALLCAEKGWTAPSFCQGLYNPLNRLVEDELLPVLRRHGIGFIAFNPLAAGLLSGKHRAGGEVLPGRFKDNQNYLPRFYTDENFAAMEVIREACQQHDVGMVSATYAWLLRHSQLGTSGAADGLLLGASSPGQLEENLAACLSAQDLPGPVVAAFDAAWEPCKPGAFPYWRSYSKDYPGRETLPPGASYQVKK